MADTPAQESVVSKPTYTTKETAEAFATLLNNETARNEEPQTSETNVEESNLEQDTAELETEVTDDQIVDNTETESDSQETLYEVTINGVKQQVTLDELTKGYSRESDYTRKTMDLSDQRKEVESMQENLKKELDAVKSSRDQYEVQIGELTKNLNQEENIDWDALYNSDPAQYVRKKAEQDKRKEALLIAQQEQQRINQEKRAEQEKVYQDYIAKERKLLADKLPIYADKDKGKDYVEKLKNFALESGYSQKELDMMVDHRAVLMLDKAFRYNQLQKTKLDKNKVNKPPRIVRSNASNVSEDSDVKQRHDRRMNKLKKSGSVRDAQSVLKEMIFNNE